MNASTQVRLRNQTSRDSSSPHDPAPQVPPAEERLDFALGCDEGYLLGAAAAIQSVLERQRGRVHLHLLVKPGVSDETRRYFARRCEAYECTLHWHPIRVELPGPKKSHLYRLLIPQLVGEEVRRVLYLDSDLVVLDDLMPLMSLPMQGRPIAAALDYLFPDMARAGAGRPDRTAIGFDGPAPYVNTGVMVLDIQAWREREITARTLEVFERHLPHMNMVDQDALNLLLEGDVLVLDPRWNLQLYCVRRPPGHLEEEHTRALGEALERPAVAHFTGKAKPWNKGDLRNPFRRPFHRAALRSGICSPKTGWSQRALLATHHALRPLSLIKPWRSSCTAAVA